jgi:glycolate oxidase FAD binding subunit
VGAAAGGAAGRVSDDARHALEEALGEGGLVEHAPVLVDALPVHRTLRPADGETLARALALLTEHGLTAVVRGGGTQLGLGNTPTSGDVLLSTERLAGVDEFDPQDGVVHAGSGTHVAELAAHVREAGWELPLEAAREGGTLGGALSVAATGPRLLGLGRARDCVLGLSVAFSTGERTSCGGRVVKNVTGYDLAKLYTGSFGTLAVLESAWLRLRPQPAARAARCLMTKGEPPGERAFAFALEASRRSSARAVAWVSPALASRHDFAPGGGTWVLAAGYAGDEASVAHDVAWLEEAGRAHGLSCVPADDTAVAQLGAAQASGRVRARIACVPTRMAEACAPLQAVAAGVIAHPGTGLVYAISEAANAERIAGAVDAARAAVDGEVRFEELPQTAKHDRDVFGDPGARLPLLRAVKQQFDPAGTLNPGRAQGRV